MALSSLDRAAQHRHPGRPVPLEKRGLRLDAGDERRADLDHPLAKRPQPLGVIRQSPALEAISRGIDPDAQRGALCGKGDKSLLERDGHTLVV